MARNGQKTFPVSHNNVLTLSEPYRAVTCAVPTVLKKWCLFTSGAVRPAFDVNTQAALVGSTPATVSIVRQASDMSSPPRQTDQWSKSATEP